MHVCRQYLCNVFYSDESIRVQEHYARTDNHDHPWSSWWWGEFEQQKVANVPVCDHMVCCCVITVCVAVWSQCVRRNRGDCARKDLWLPQQSIGRWGQVCVNANVLLFVTILPHVLIRSFFLVFARFFSWKSFNIFPFFSANVPLGTP